jgi:hypothetical protein
MFVLLANFDILMTHTQKKKSQNNIYKGFYWKEMAQKSPNYEKN